MGYFRNDIGADAIFYVDTYSCMDSGMNIYDTAHREDAAIAFPGDETGCGAVALLPALEIGVKFTLIGYARLRRWTAGAVNKANDESKAACPNVFCPTAVSGDWPL